MPKMVLLVVWAVGLPIGLVVFGTGPAFFGLLWLHLFPESRLGDESWWRSDRSRREPPPE